MNDERVVPCLEIYSFTNPAGTVLVGSSGVSIYVTRHANLQRFLFTPGWRSSDFPSPKDVHVDIVLDRYAPAGNWVTIEDVDHPITSQISISGVTITSEPTTPGPITVHVESHNTHRVAYLSRVSDPVIHIFDPSPTLLNLDEIDLKLKILQAVFRKSQGPLTNLLLPAYLRDFNYVQDGSLGAWFDRASETEKSVFGIFMLEDVCVGPYANISVQHSTSLTPQEILAAKFTFRCKWPGQPSMSRDTEEMLKNQFDFLKSLQRSVHEHCVVPFVEEHPDERVLRCTFQTDLIFHHKSRLDDLPNQNTFTLANWPDPLGLFRASVDPADYRVHVPLEALDSSGQPVLPQRYPAVFTPRTWVAIEAVPVVQDSDPEGDPHLPTKSFTLLLTRITAL